MAVEKKANCKICGKEFTYSQEWADSMLSEGFSPPEYCNEHRKFHAKEKSAIAMPYFYPVPVVPRRPDHELDAGRLGKLTHYDRLHRTVETTAKFHLPNSDIDFGIKDENFLELKEKLDNNQVVVVVGPTGSGKSTFLPYRLLAPPEPIARDYFTRFGQIIVTQPRLQATRTIPEFVARDLHGCTLGAGGEIGFIHRGDRSADNHTKLIYCTDGTLINWIANGKLSDIGIIVIDEAHERSLNIDVILGLLKLKLPLYPQLKVIIASATIDTDLFKNYFSEVAKTEFQNFKGLKHFDYVKVWQEKKISDNPHPVNELPPHIVEKTIHILNSIASNSEKTYFPESDNKTSFPEGDKKTTFPEGDILIFLPTVQSIDKTCETLRDRIGYEKQLTDRGIQVFPLHRRIPLDQQNLALQKKSKALAKKTIKYFSDSDCKDSNVLVLTLDTKSAVDTAKYLKESLDLNKGFEDIVVNRFGDGNLADYLGEGRTLIVSTFDEVKPPYPERINQIITDRRIVVSTNVAETSLTVDGIVYVIDSGLILQTEWDVDLFVEGSKTSWHSRDGCRQRWGRAGRVRDGWAYTLYTEQQFEGIKNKQGEYIKNQKGEFKNTGFDEHTVAEISRAPLEAVILSAKRAGVDDVINFPWIEKPDPKELERAIKVLKERKILDSDGDLTNHGEVVGQIGDKPNAGHLLVLADQLNCAIEVATFIPMMESNVRGGLLRWHHQWDGHTRRQVRKIHQSLKFGCKDDLEFYLKLFHCWYVSYEDAWKWLTDSYFDQLWTSFIPPFNEEMQLKENEQTLQDLLSQIKGVRSISELDQIQSSFSGSTTLIQSWISEARDKYIELRRKAWCQRFFVNYETLAKVEKSRMETIEKLSIGKKQVEVRPIHFGKRLDRVRMVIGYAWNDLVYKKTDGSFKSTNHFVEANEQNFDVILDQNSLAKTDIEAFVCCKKRVEKYKKLIFTNLIIHQNKEWIDDYQKPWMQIIQSIAKTESQQRQDLPVGTVFLDQLYPINSTLNVQIDSLSEKNTYKVDFENLVSAPPDIVETSPEGEIIYSEDPADFISPELDLEAGSQLDVEVFQDPEEPDPLKGLDLDENGEELIDTLLDSSIANASIVGADLFTSLNIERFSPEGRLLSELIETSDLSTARVIEHVVEDSITPCLSLKKVSHPDEFERFQADHSEGEIVFVRATEYEQLTGDKQISLVVKPDGFDLEVVMDARDLFFSGRYELIKLIEIGTGFHVYIEKIDPDRQRIKLTTLPLLEKFLPDPGVLLSGKIFSKSDEGVHLVIEHTGYETLPIPISVYVEKGHLPQALLSVEKGATIEVRILPQQESNVKTPLFPGSFLTVFDHLSCSESFVWDQENRQLSVKNRVKYSDLDFLLKQTSDQKLRRSLIELYVQSNRINAEPILLERLTEYQVDQKYTGIVSNVTPSEVTIQFEQGVFARIDRNHINLPKKYIGKGRSFECMVKSVNNKSGLLEIDLPNQNDYLKRRYPEGKELEGEVTGIKDCGLFVKIDEGVSGLLPHKVVTAFSKVNPSSVFKIGDKTRVVIKSINSANELSLDLPSIEQNLFNLYETVDGIIIKVLDYSALVKIDSGVVGKVSKNEIAWDSFDTVAQKISPNQKVRVKILDLSKIDKGDVSLSIKKADLTFKVILVPSHKIGRVIGKEHRNINNIMLRTSTHIEVGDAGKLIVWYRSETDALNAIHQINQFIKD